MQRTEAVIDLRAIGENVATLKASTTAQVLAVVKADAYGHGLLPCARAALGGGATWLGTAVIEEALLLRAEGIEAPLLAWLWTPGESDTVVRAVNVGIDLSVSSLAQLDTVRAAAAHGGHAARIHLKIDTGLTRNGCYVTDWPDLLRACAKAQAGNDVEIVGVWSHFAYADEPGHPAIARQLAAFADALEVAKRFGVEPQLRHLANSAATLTLPQAHFDLVRPGVAVYGLSPVPDQGTFGLRPAMTVRATIALAKHVRAGEGVSYGHTYTTPRDTGVALVPLGYADGVPRAAGNAGPVLINGRRYTVSGRVCMDQFVVDVGDDPVAAGDEAILFGPGGDGEPLAQDWADAAGTIHYEIVTRIGPRVPRVYV
ncbi:MAG: alanine racemase [Actinomycetota bacterium]|nr:alanine racemase [Actinomycetota bacterium]